MKRLEIIVAHILFWQLLPLCIIYFIWAAQDTTALPGMTNSSTQSFMEVAERNVELLLIVLIAAIPIFYASFGYLTPRFLFKSEARSVLLYCTAFILYIAIFIIIMGISEGLFYFTGVPTEVKLTLPIILMSGVGGTLYAYLKK